MNNHYLSVKLRLKTIPEYYSYKVNKLMSGQNAVLKLLPLALSFKSVILANALAEKTLYLIWHKKSHALWHSKTSGELIVSIRKELSGLSKEMRKNFMVPLFLNVTNLPKQYPLTK